MNAQGRDDWPCCWRLSSPLAISECVRCQQTVVCASQLYFTCSPDEGKPAQGVWYTWDWHHVAEVLCGDCTADIVRFARLQKSQDGKPKRSAILCRCATQFSHDGAPLATNGHTVTRAAQNQLLPSLLLNHDCATLFDGQQQQLISCSYPLTAVCVRRIHVALIRGGQTAYQRPSEAAQHAAAAAIPSGGGAAVLPLTAARPDGGGTGAAAMQLESGRAPSQQPRRQAQTKGGQAKSAGTAARAAARSAETPPAAAAAAAGHARHVHPVGEADGSSDGAAVTGRPKRKRSQMRGTEATASGAGGGSGSPSLQPPAPSWWRPSAEPGSGKFADPVESKVTTERCRLTLNPYLARTRKSAWRGHTGAAVTEMPPALADVPDRASCCLRLQALTASDVKHWDRYVVVSEGMALAVLPRHQTPLQQGVEWLLVSVVNPTRLLSVL